MSASTTARWLAEAVVQATRSSNYCVAGCLPAVDPRIEVDGLGAVTLPIKRGVAQELVAACRVAPYGKGTRTLVDRSVRNTFELDPTKFRLGEEWNAAVGGAVRLAAEQLGLPAERVEARLYKLLVYEKGGFFLPHRDSEKHDRMVASLIVVLPSPFEGGELVVRHGAGKQTLEFEEAAEGMAPCYAAFYADCEHEVKRVTGGVRLCLAYNLVLKGGGGQPVRSREEPPPADALVASIRSWTTMQPDRPLVMALGHHYTERGLALDLLKGADRKLAELVVPAAKEAHCMVHLAQVCRHLQQYADDGGYRGGYRRGYRPSYPIEIGETYEDDFQCIEWTDLAGKKQPWGPIGLESSDIVSSIPIDDWTPTSEEFEGYTGNAGNTLDRWYHRSAIVVWHRDHHFDVVARSGAAVSIPICRSMVAKLAKTPKRRLETARADCLRFARAIIARWPGSSVDYRRSEKRERSPQDGFPGLLLKLRDRETIALFLSRLADRDVTLRLASFVVRACRAFGWSAFARELRRLMAVPPSEPDRWGQRVRQEIPFRDVEWLSALCLDESPDADRSALADELCELAVKRFCAPYPNHEVYYERGYRRISSISEESLPILLKALVAAGREEDLHCVLQFVESQPDEFRLDDCQVPTLATLVPWSRRKYGVVHPPLESWLASVRHKLETATARQPEPPVDWARSADVDCGCVWCAQLKDFLADAAANVERIKAREETRRHLINKICRHECDVNHSLERKGTPYTLVLTKTTASFERAVKQFEADRRLLQVLVEVSQEASIPTGTAS
jgi:hypothetical protein